MPKMPRSNKSMEAKKNEKVFEHYLEFPSDVRRMIIDEMAADDRWRFAGCSSLCQKEAKSSNNFIYELVLETYPGSLHTKSKITIIPGKYENDEDQKGFVLRFTKNGEGQCVKYTRVGDETALWTNPLDNSVDLIEYANEHFKNLLTFYHKSIRKLMMNPDGNILENCDIKTKTFNNLEDVAMYNSLISLKTRRPLKLLGTSMTVPNEKIEENFDQISKVEKILHLPNAQFTREQLQRISAEIFKINIGTLTEDDILRFIRSWQNGTLGRKLDWCEWTLRNSNFDVLKLLRLLGAQNNHSVTIKHDTDAEKFGEVCYFEIDGVLGFETFDLSSV